MFQNRIEELHFLENRLRMLNEMENSISDLGFLISESSSQTKEEYLIMVGAWNYELSELHTKKLELINAINNCRSILDDPEKSGEFDDYAIVETPNIHNMPSRQVIYNEAVDDGVSDEDRVIRIIDRGDGDLLGY